MEGDKAATEYNNGNYEVCLAELNNKDTGEDAADSADADADTIAYNKALTTLRLQGDTTQALANFAKHVNLSSAEVRLPEAALCYARACLLYHSRKYARALLIADKLLPLLEQLTDKELARRIVLLTMALHLARGAPAEALHLADAKATSTLMEEASNHTADVWARLKLRAALAQGKKDAPVDGGKSHAWDLLRAHQLYVNGEYDQAAAVLEAMNLENAEPEVEVCRDADLALCRAAKKQNWAAVSKTQKALRKHLSIASEHYAWPRDRLPLINNLGLLLLRASRPDRAFECLVEAANRRPGDPRAWLRLASCCLASCCRDPNAEDPPFALIGTGAHVRLVPAARPADGTVSSDESYAVPTPSAEFASLCLVNAKVLLSSFGGADPTKTESLKEMRRLLCCYDSLRLADSATAIREAEAVIRGDNRPIRKLLAMLYLAEAQARSGRIEEAAMSFKNCLRISSEMKIPARDTVLNAAKIGLIACAAIAGDSVAARELLKQADLPDSAPLRFYLEVKSGAYESAAELLREKGRSLIAR